MSQQDEIERYTRMALERGGTVNGQRAEPAPPKKSRQPALADGFVVMDGAVLRAVIPVATTTEVNQRDFRGRSRRTDVAWKAVSKTFGPHLEQLSRFATAYHAGKSLRVILTRLGGHKCDHSNLSTATKAVEDVIAFFLGADDGDPRWHPEFRQKPGGDVGVMVQIEVMQ